VNPRDINHIVGTAFTPDPLGGNLAPVYVSGDGGATWTLRSIVPSDTETGDICVGFGPTGELYAGILKLPSPPNNTRLNILRTKNVQSSTPMTVLVDRIGVDQPYVQSPQINGVKTKDRLYVGDNDLGSSGTTSTIDYSLNAKVAKATFKKAVLLEADGTTAKHGKVSTANGITKWRFVFDNQSTQGSRFASVFVVANKGHFGKVTGMRGPFLEDRRITKPPKMTLATAVKKLRAKHYSGGFYDVTLRWPLGPGFNETLYIFGFGQAAKHPYVSVGTQTGRVKPLS